MSASVTVTARRLGSATAVAAALVGALALPASAAAPHRGPVVISAVQHDVQGREVTNRALNREWVDVTNTSRRDVNLSGWTLSDAAGHSYTFHHYQLAGRATVRVHTGEGRDTVQDLYQDRRKSVWDHGVDTATLRNEHGGLVDSVTWGHRHRVADGGHHRVADGGHHRVADGGHHRVADGGHHRVAEGGHARR